MHPTSLPISALQHLLFCERQCALIHIEQLWAENRLTIEGQHLHEKTHGQREGPRGGGRFETRQDGDGNPIRTVRRLQLRSKRLGLYGVADVIEFHAKDDDTVAVPVEYKRGRAKKDDSDRVQLCAQAICLEEMLDHPPGTISTGALYYGKTRRRLQVKFDAQLRKTTESAAARLHELLHAGITPRAAEQPKCAKCSMYNLCLPNGTGPNRSASRYLARSLAAASRGHVPLDTEDDQ